MFLTLGASSWGDSQLPAGQQGDSPVSCNVSPGVASHRYSGELKTSLYVQPTCREG